MQLSSDSPEAQRLVRASSKLELCLSTERPGIALTFISNPLFPGFLRAGPEQLRLQSARELMLMDGLDAAYEVGYESVSRFSREYSRFFGQPPIRDIKALKGSNTGLVY